MGEYSKYNVNELLEITTADDEESMRSIATGWVNTGAVLSAAKEALAERLEEMRKVWTAPSFAAFEKFIHTTIAQVEAAHTQAENRSDAADLIASTAGWAKKGVKEQHDEYLKKKGESPDGMSGVPLIGGIPGFVPGPVVVPFPDSSTPTDEEIRKPYDEQSRKIMKIALGEYETQKPPMTQEVVRFTPIPPPHKQWMLPGGEDWGSGGTGGSNASDMAGLSATSYGSNAFGSQSPSLQSAGPTYASPTPSPGGGLPTGPPGGTPVFNGPSVGGLPPGVVNKTPTAPPKLPGPGGSGPRNYLSPRTTGPATKTPGLPTQRNGMSPRGTGPNGRPVGNKGGTVPTRAGRGPQKSQMAPKDLTKRVRSSGEVIGRRGTKSTSKTSAAKPNPTPRRVQPSVVRGAKGIAKEQGRKAPLDNTKRGYSSRVINPRNRISEATGHSRTPFVGEKMKHAANPEPIGKRQELESGRSRARREIDALREQRRQKLEQPDGLSRPVIDNGLTNTVDIHDVAPTQRAVVKSEEPLWQPQKAMVSPVIGRQRWNPDAYDHDPGPKAFHPRQAFIDDLDARLGKSHDPGPTAFDSKRQPNEPWPRE